MAGDEPVSDNEPNLDEVSPAASSEAGTGVTFTPGTAAAIIGGIVAIVVVLALVLQDGGDDSGPASVLSPTTVDPAGDETTVSVPAIDFDRPEIPQVSCGALWGDDELVLALGSEERSYSDLGSMTLSRGEVCLEQLANYDGYFIQVEPGDPADFVDGAVLNDVTGVVAEGVGDDARWFGGPADAPALLAVFEETPVGELFFRLSIGRPDLSGDEQLAVITELARAVLPNFPYVEVEPPEPEVIEIDRGLLSREPHTLDELVSAGADDGEWTLGEGLVSALRWLADEPSDFEPPTSFDVTNGSATGVILLALDYVDHGPDEASRAEVERLLAKYRFPEPPEDPPAEEEPADDEVALGVGSGAPVFASFSPLQEAPEELDCGADAVWFDVDCTVVEEIGGVRFGFPRGAIEGSVAGWDIEDIEAIRAAIQTTVDEYTKYGTFIHADLLLSPHGGGFGSGRPSPVGDRCVVSLRTDTQGLAADSRGFVVALELAGCFAYENLPVEVFLSGYDAAKWWYQGLVLYLAAEAYPHLDLEWGGPFDRLQSAEISTSLQDRAVENWAFFRSFANQNGGPAAALDLVRPLTNAPTKQDQQDKFAAQSTSDPALHVFHQELTDGTIPETGGTAKKYDPESSIEMELAGEMVILDDPLRFGVSRVHLTVAPGERACLDYDISGNIITSWREGPPGSEGSWTFELPDEITGESVFVATTVEEGETFTISAEVSEEPGCEDEDEGSPSDIELPDCGICAPSAFYRFLGALADALG